MAKRKFVQHLPAPTPPSPPSPPAASPPAPRLAVQLFAVAGEMVAVAIFAIGFATVAGSLIAGPEMRSRAERHPTPQPREVWRCAYDRYGEFCRPVDRGTPARRFYARDGV